MGAYFGNISRRQLLLFKFLHRRSICARPINFMSRPADETFPVKRGLSQLSLAKGPSTSELRLSQTSIRGDTSLPVSSSEWRALRTKILLRDKCTCSSCGYVSPCPNGRWMTIDHKDRNASNNAASNLRIYCPPCEAIRHCGTSGLQNWLVAGELLSLGRISGVLLSAQCAGSCTRSVWMEYFFFQFAGTRIMTPVRELLSDCIELSQRNGVLSHYY